MCCFKSWVVFCMLCITICAAGDKQAPKTLKQVHVVSLMNSLSSALFDLFISFVVFLLGKIHSLISGLYNCFSLKSAT